MEPLVIADSHLNSFPAKDSRQIGAFHERCTAQLPCKINWNQSSVLEDIFTFGLNIETQTQRLPSLHTPTWTTPMYSWGISPKPTRRKGGVGGGGKSGGNGSVKRGQQCKNLRRREIEFRPK